MYEDVGPNGFRPTRDAHRQRGIVLGDVVVDSTGRAGVIGGVVLREYGRRG